MVFVKHAPARHPQAALVEAAGLRWLAEAAREGGAPVARVLSATEGAGPEAGRLSLEELVPADPTRQAALEFGRRLARTHGWLSSPVGFGALPPEHPRGAPAFFGPADHPLVMGTGVHTSWGAFQARERLDPVLDALGTELSVADRRALGAARDRIEAGELDDAGAPALIHGDLWSGNVLWSPSGPEGATQAVLVDPAAHAGHRETDIALLHLFGLPQLEAVMAGYQDTAPLSAGWEDRIPLHQFFCLSVHWLLFGQTYRGPTLSAAERIREL